MITSLGLLETSVQERRRFLIASAVGAGSTLLPGGLIHSAFAAGTDYTLGSSIRSLSSAFYVAWNKSAMAYARSVDQPYATLITEGKSEKSIGDIKALLEKINGRLVLGAEPDDSSDARLIVEAVAKAGGYVVTVSNKSADLHPWDYGENYVAHFSFNGVPAGEQTAKALFDSFGGSGGIVALGGIPSHPQAIQRRTGLMNAIKATGGKVELLDFQDADADSTKANNIVAAWIAHFGSNIKGIWAANDDMAIGALKALHREALAGKVLVTGIDGTRDAVTAVKNKELAATVEWNPYWIGGTALSLGYHAASGKITPSKEPHEHREFYGTGVLITQHDVQEYWRNNTDRLPATDFNDLWEKISGPIT